MKAAIVGSSGYLAGYLIRKLERDKDIETVLKIGRTGAPDIPLDLERPDAFDFKQLSGVDYVIFTAAISGPDRCAAEFEYCWQINVVNTCLFIQRAMAQGCRVLFFSSDAVFGSGEDALCDENSPTMANTPYGRMKKAVEDTFAGDPRFKAIRLSYVVSAKDRFVSYCLKCIEKDETADVFHPFYRNCIVVSDVLDAVVWLIHNWERFSPVFLNIAGAELISRLRIADELNSHLRNKLRYTISFPGASFFENRARITRMSSLYLKEYDIISRQTFSEKLKKELEGLEV